MTIDPPANWGAVVSAFFVVRGKKTSPTKSASYLNSLVIDDLSLLRQRLPEVSVDELNLNLSGGTVVGGSLGSSSISKLPSKRKPEETENQFPI